MKANLFPQAEVASAMKDFVLLERYTDGSDEQARQNQDYRRNSVLRDLGSLLESPCDSSRADQESAGVFCISPKERKTR
jgi:hypothetical protein